MARKETIVSIVDGRDKDRDFLIIEMSAIRAEKWATKALLALVSSGGDIGDNVNINGGIQELAKVGIKALVGLKYEYVEPLMDEMFECWFYLREKGDKTKKIPLTVENCENFIEDAATLLKLRSETLSLHLGFSLADKISASLPGQEEKPAEEIKSSTKTGLDISEQLHQGEWQAKKN